MMIVTKTAEEVMRIQGITPRNPRILSGLTMAKPKFPIATASDTLEIKSSPASISEFPKEYVSRWDIPGVYTYEWLSSISKNFKAAGDYASQMGKYTGGLMVLASPLIVPLSLAVDAINTLIFPGKLLYRALR